MLLKRASFSVLIIINIIVSAFTQECWQRDEVAAGRSCERACQSDGTCRKKNRECVCDGLCGPSCLRKRCPLLPAPQNGNKVINPNDRTIGAEVTYSCNSGYTISGQTNRICQANKTWSGTEPTCTESTAEGFRQLCLERDEAASGRNCGTACQPDGTCKKQNRECVCDGLCGLTCLTKRCPPLTTPRNGNLAINPSDRTIGAEVTYSCDNGYVMSGRRNRMCQANKTWSGREPTCVQSTTEVLCPLLELSGGSLEYRDTNSRIVAQPRDGDIRTATCLEGYILKGMRQSICSLGEWQDELPDCLRVPCPILDLEDGVLGYLDKNNQRVFEPRHGDIRVASCNDGRILQGTSETRCISGAWQEELPSCEQVVGCLQRQCENGGTCSTNGTCTCPEGVYGMFCEDLRRYQEYIIRIVPAETNQLRVGHSVGFLCETNYSFAEERPLWFDNQGQPVMIEDLTERVYACEVSDNATWLIVKTLEEDDIGHYRCEAGKFLSVDMMLYVHVPTCEQPCLNGGACVFGVCSCPRGFYGHYCQNRGYFCARPCENGGYCLDGECQCRRGFTGSFCQIETISCPPPEQPDIGVLTHNRVNSNRNG